jgi:hypothetical protein
MGGDDNNDVPLHPIELEEKHVNPSSRWADAAANGPISLQVGAEAVVHSITFTVCKLTVVVLDLALWIWVLARPADVEADTVQGVSYVVVAALALEVILRIIAARRILQFFFVRQNVLDVIILALCFADLMFNWHLPFRVTNSTCLTHDTWGG